MVALAERAQLCFIVRSEERACGLRRAYVTVTSFTYCGVVFMIGKIFFVDILTKKLILGILLPAAMLTTVLPTV